MHIFGFERDPWHALSCSIRCGVERDKKGEKYLFTDLDYLAIPKLTKQMRNMLIHREWRSLFNCLNEQNAVALTQQQVMEKYYDPEKMRQLFT